MYSRLKAFLEKNKREPLNHSELSLNLTDAAVLVLLWENGGEHHLILTKRSEEVLHHKGQICFPGGVRDTLDESLWMTALRETEEEIGLKSQEVHYIGQLGQVLTPTGYRVTPYVAALTEIPQWRKNPTEIADVFTVTVSHLLRPESFKMVTRKFFEQSYEDPLFTYGDYEIWGATGRILVDLLEVWKGVFEFPPL